MSALKPTPGGVAFATIILFTLLSAPASGQEVNQTRPAAAVPRRGRAEVVLTKIQQGVEAAWAICRLAGKCDSAPAYDGRIEGETLPPPDTYYGFAPATSRQPRAPSAPPRPRFNPQSLFGGGSRRVRI